MSLDQLLVTVVTDGGHGVILGFVQDVGTGTFRVGLEFSKVTAVSVVLLILLGLRHEFRTAERGGLVRGTVDLTVLVTLELVLETTRDVVLVGALVASHDLLATGPLVGSGGHVAGVTHVLVLVLVLLATILHHLRRDASVEFLVLDDGLATAVLGLEQLGLATPLESF